MLLYSTRTAVFKNEGKGVLLCKITLPKGADDGELSARISHFYKGIYDVTCSFADRYAKGILPDGRLRVLTVRCEESAKKNRLIIKRTYALSGSRGAACVRTFVDKFKIKCDKTKKSSLTEQK